MAVYKFKEGAHLYGDAQRVGERLDQLRAQVGGLTPEHVVADAADAGSVLHPFFEWDDAKAAQKHRVYQAGHLLRCVTVVMEDAPEAAERTVRAFLPVEKITGERVYESTATALSDAEYRKQVLAQAHGELGAIARKYRDLKELSEVVGAIDRVGEILKEGQPA